MTRIIWAGPARRDIERIRNHLDSKDADLFPLIAAEIVAAARFIAATPKAAPLAGYTFQRKWRVKRYPDLIFYRLLEDGISVTRVRHASEDWLSELE